MNHQAGRIVIAGGSGFLGQALAAHFLSTNREVVILTRFARPSGVAGKQVVWDAATLGVWQNELDGATAVVNLTGRSVNCRYNARNRSEILESRVESTRAIGEAIARCANPPAVWLNATEISLIADTKLLAVIKRRLALFRALNAERFMGPPVVID